MPAPLIWLGAGLLSLYAGNKLQRHESSVCVSVYPGESRKTVSPVDGSVVCCGIYGTFEHSGIWLDGHIVELRGNGLIRAISPRRFLQQRSGKQIYVLCDTSAQPLVAQLSAQQAMERLYKYSEYHLIRNNCHRFVWRCIEPQSRLPITSFYDLNQALSRHFSKPLLWQPIRSDLELKHY